jgi:CheY-like chemotaxis protein
MKDISFLEKNGVDIKQSLELFGDAQTYNDTIGEFLVGIHSKINQLIEMMNNSDMNNYSITVHSLKSDAKYFGFNKLRDIAYDHELKSKGNDYYYVKEHFPELKNEVEVSKKIVKEYMSDNTEETVIQKEEPINTKVYEKDTILVVDDSNIVRNFVKRLFQDQYEIDCANDGEEALNIIKTNKDNNKIICILLDLNMPKVSGFNVLDYMKENDLFKTSPVAIITGDSSKDTIDKAFTYGIVDMLGKPFNGEDVKRVIDKCIYYREMNN